MLGLCCVLMGFGAVIFAAHAVSSSKGADPEQDLNNLCSLRLAGGWVVDGSGDPGYLGDVLLSGNRILAAIDSGAREQFAATESLKCSRVLDVSGLVVAPGFINMLSWASGSLLFDPRALSDVKQGVTLEVMGEGRSMGPFFNPQPVKFRSPSGAVKFASSFRTLGDYFGLLERGGIGVNVASYVGATTIREFVVGGANRPPTDKELRRMVALVSEAMQEGAMGVGSSLIYAPASFATTDELIALSSEAARYDGGYISHLRSESGKLLPALREFIKIARESRAKAEIYHFKAAGRANWERLDVAIAEVEEARSEGLQISANIYPYTVGASGLDVTMPAWVQEGGIDDWVARLRDPKIRAEVIRQMRDPEPDWENFLLDGAENARLLGFRNYSLRRYQGMTLAEVALERGVSPEDAAIDLVIADHSKVSVAYKLMSERNVRKKLALDWVSIGSDASAPAAEGRFLNRDQHPRAYGSFARLLGEYVRDEHVLELEDAIYRITGLPAANLGLSDRGRLVPGYFADLAIFAADTVTDKATFENSHRYAEGVQHVFVNGAQVLEDGEPTGLLPGRIVRGPGWETP